MLFLSCITLHFFKKEIGLGDGGNTLGLFFVLMRGEVMLVFFFFLFSLMGQRSNAVGSDICDEERVWNHLESCLS